MHRIGSTGWASLGTAILILCGTAITGCGGSGMTKVEGTVTIDGNPLGNGAIAFEAVDGKGPVAGATIVNGKYVTYVPPGVKSVRITGFEVTGQEPMYQGRPDGPKRDIVKDVVPAKYNTNSELSFTVDSSGTPGDFELTSS